MRLATCAFALSVLCTMPASAEVLVSTQDNIADDGMLTLALPAGEVEITMNTVEGTGLFVHAGGSHEVLVESAHIPRLLKTYNNSALLELYTDTSACPILFGWVTYDGQALRASEEFGTCAEEARYEETASGPVVSMDDPGQAGRIVHYGYDEASAAITETAQ